MLQRAPTHDGEPKFLYRTVSAYADLLSIPAMEKSDDGGQRRGGGEAEYTEEDYAYAAQFAADENLRLIPRYSPCRPDHQPRRCNRMSAMLGRFPLTHGVAYRSHHWLCPSTPGRSKLQGKPSIQGHALRGADLVCGCEVVPLKAPERRALIQTIIRNVIDIEIYQSMPPDSV